MDNTRSFLYELVRSELFQLPVEGRKLSHEEYVSLMEQADVQTVSGLVAESLMRNEFMLQKDDAINLFSRSKNIGDCNDLINKNIGGFSGFLNHHQIEYVVVKGQTMATLYPNPRSRVTGDVDVYFPGENFAKVKSMIESAYGRELGKYSDGKHVEIVNDGITFELHDVLSRFANSKHQKYWDKLIDDSIQEGVAYVNVGGFKIATLSPTYNVLFIFVHLFYHMTASGVGLRQFCDLAMLLHVCHRNGAKESMRYKEGLHIDAPLLRSMLEELGYFRAFKAIGAFLIAYLGLPSNEFPFELSERDKKWVPVIEKNVSLRGNFGRANRKVSKAGILHSLETGCLSVKQAWVYYRLAPKEVLGRSSKLSSWFFKRFTVNKQ